MLKKDITMIFDIMEMSSLFEKSNSLDDFLQSAVSVVAYHMKAAVCSIYIYDEKSRVLTLRATQGLNEAAVGRVSLRIGQGLVGLSLRELRAVRSGHASANPRFYAVSGINEERYESFLAVPIRRGLTRVGVLVVQDGELNYFNEKDEDALRAIAAQLATVIENATLLQEMHRGDSAAADAGKPVPVPKMLRGRPAAGGAARGRATFIISGRGSVFHVPAAVPENQTVDDFDRALAATEAQLKGLQREATEELSDVAQLIFNAHLLILADDEFSGEIRRLIQHGVAPAVAIADVVNRYISIFSASSNQRLQEKVHDIQDLGHRLMENLTGGDRVRGDYSGRIIIADSLMPSDILKLATEKAEGFIVQGGVTSHNAIISRSLQKPMVMIDPQQMDVFNEFHEILMDGNSGLIYINPEENVRKEYTEYSRTVAAMKDAETVKTETFTADGAQVHLFANVNLLSDLKTAVAFKAEGIGLYRSEFPFIIRNAFPSEEEQFHVYRQLADEMNGREVTFRTLDIGGDKMLSYQQHSDEEEANPVLGLRAIRFSLMHKDIFSEQLRAMLRAAAGGNARIMFPLIASVDDFLEARAVVYDCMSQLEARGEPYSRDIKIGIMVELPSAVELIEDLAHEVDFVSIGTNDLIQYTLAVDRTNDLVSKMYLPYHPAILRSVERVTRIIKSHRKDVSICGDIAIDERMIPFLLGAGITKLSIPPRYMPAVQRAVEKVRIEKAVYTVHRMLSCSRIAEVEEIINESV